MVVLPEFNKPYSPTPHLTKLRIDPYQDWATVSRISNSEAPRALIASQKHCQEDWGSFLYFYLGLWSNNPAGISMFKWRHHTFHASSLHRREVTLCQWCLTAGDQKGAGKRLTVGTERGNDWVTTLLHKSPVSGLVGRVPELPRSGTPPIMPPTEDW